jgi:hypothetical protein
LAFGHQLPNQGDDKILVRAFAKKALHYRPLDALFARGRVDVAELSIAQQQPFVERNGALSSPE